MQSSLNRRILALFTALAAVVAAPTPGLAAVPGTLAVHGVVAGTGGAAPDGKYIASFSIYSTKTGGTAVWTEGLLPLSVVGGRFSTELGKTKPLTPTLLASLKAAWLGVAIDLNAEQERVRLHSVLYAVTAQAASGLSCSGCVEAGHLKAGAITPSKVGFNYAGSSSKGGSATSALGISCTNCVSVAALKFDGDVNIGTHTFTATKITAGSIVAQTINGLSFVGDGSKLTGIKTPAGSCKTKGHVVKGINPDGTLQCVAGGGSSGLPPDGIDEISNGLIYNEFVDSASAGPFKIPDNNPIGVSSVIDVPDTGAAKVLTIAVDLETSGLSQLELTLYDPLNTKYVLLAKKSGQGTKLKTSYPDLSKPASGDLSAWNGKNPKGKWRLLVTDYEFKDNKFDGQIKSWSVNSQTLSNKKIQIKGDLIVDGTVTGSNGFKIVGDTSFDGKATFNDEVEFKKPVILSGGITFGEVQHQFFTICSDNATVGPCRAELAHGRPFLEAAQHCAAKKGDLCTDSQSTAVRAAAGGKTIYNFQLLPNWTNSYADNDGSQWNVANGGTGDNHSDQSHYLALCCHNITPKQPGEQVIGGVRVLKIHNSQNTNWANAVKACLALKADLCDKGQYRVLRNKGKISVAVWASDHSDNDNTSNDKALAGVSDNPSPGNGYGYACCATNRTELKCPANSQEISGVCVAKIHNSQNATFNTAATQCANLGARICSISQTAVLRKAGKVTVAASWTASFSDNDGGQAKSGVGNAGDDHSHNSSYGYACCY